MMNTHTHLLIIGGGMAGLSAAWQAQQRGWRYTLLEASTRLGGMVQTDTLQGCIAEAGPESFITRKPQLWQMAQDLGLQHGVVPIQSEAKGTAILHNGHITPVPLNPVSFVGSSLLSWSAKLRLLKEPFVAARRDNADESLAEFGARRLGREASQHLVEPILSGIYSSDPETQSVLTTASILREMEQHGSLVKGMQAMGKARRAARKSNPSAAAHAIPRSFTFVDGAETIVQALQAHLTGCVRKEARVTCLRRVNEQWQVTLANDEVITGDAVVLAVQANLAATLLAKQSPEAARQLALIRHDGIGSVTLLYRQVDVPSGLTGLMIPRREGRRIDAITIRGGHRVTPGHALVRVFVGGGDPALLTLTEAALLQVVRDELRTVLQLNAAPSAHIIQRWANFPKPEVGHLERVAKIEALLPAGLSLAGNSYRGIGLPDVVQSGLQAVDKLI